MKQGRIGALGLTLSSLLACAHAAGPERRSLASEAVACPPGAEPGRSGCACRPDLWPVLGACVSSRTAAAFCGPAALATAAGCSPRPRCDPGRALELGSGVCLPRREARAIAVGLGILVGEGELVGCPAGGLLAAESDGAGGPSRLGCIARPSSPARPCAAGTLAAANGTCLRVYDGKTVDVAGWLRAAFGGDGADSPLCEALARSPGVLGPPRPPPSGSVVALVFPDNDVSLVRSSSTAELDGVLFAMTEALRSFGGTASQAALSIRVVCRKSQEERPAVITPENDHEK